MTAGPTSPHNSGWLDAVADPGHDRDLQSWVAWTAGPWQEFDPEQLDINAVNNELTLLLSAAAVNEPGSQSLIQERTQRLPPGIRRDFRSYLAGAGLGGPALVEADVAEAMIAPYHLWLTRRIGHDGLSLTAAGWLPQAVVHEAMTELGWTRDWIGKANREDQTLPVLRLRESAQHLGLIRKIKGRIVLTSATKRVLDDPMQLWLFLAQAIAHRHRHDSQRDAPLLLLLEVAGGKRTVWDGRLPRSHLIRAHRSRLDHPHRNRTATRNRPSTPPGAPGSAPQPRHIRRPRRAAESQHRHAARPDLRPRRPSLLNRPNQ
jgi:hypothetical protein